MALWADSKAELAEALRTSEIFLCDELQLTLKPTPYVNRVEHGMDFLGCRIYRWHRVLNRRSRRRYRRKLAWLERCHDSGQLTERQLQDRATAMSAFRRTPGLCSWRFRQSVLQNISVSSPGPCSG